MAKNRKPTSPVIDYILILAGTALMAITISSILEPAGLVTGGFSGIAIMVKTLTGGLVDGGIPLWITNIVLNIPLFIFGIAIMGYSFLARSIFGAAALSFWLAVLPVFPLAAQDTILAALYGGVIQGAGIGLVFVGKGTTGGSDTTAAIIQRYIRHYSIAQVMQVVDGVIVIAGAFVFGISNAMYAIISIYIVSKVTDGIIEGLKFSKVVYIITNQYQEVADTVMSRLDRGVTGIHARGMYSDTEKTMLFCVVSKKQIVGLKDLVHEVDPGAFLIVGDAREVLGEGFIH